MQKLFTNLPKKYLIKYYLHVISKKIIMTKKLEFNNCNFYERNTLFQNETLSLTNNTGSFQVLYTTGLFDSDYRVNCRHNANTNMTITTILQASNRILILLHPWGLKVKVINKLMIHICDVTSKYHQFYITSIVNQSNLSAFVVSKLQPYSVTRTNKLIMSNE